MFEILPQRELLSKGKIAIAITDVLVTSNRISLSLEITNMSSEDVVLKKPRSTGFGSADSYVLVFNDMYLYLVDSGGGPVNVNPTSQYKLKPEMRDEIEMDYLHVSTDFVLLKPKLSFRYKYDEAKPMEWIMKNGNTESLAPLPPGKYGIYASYENKFVGYYDMPDNFKNYSFLIEEDNYIWDLNAWVGTVPSTVVDFIVK